MSQPKKVLSGKVAVVTGSTRGIGLGVATQLAMVGADVILNGKHPTPRDPTILEKVGAYGTRVRYFGADMRRRADIESLVRFTEKELGSIDILVNNAGVTHISPVETFPLEMWDEIIAMNLTAPFHATQLCLPGMRQRGWGRVINIASVHGLVSSVHKSAYCAAKHGLIGFTKTVALETATTGITCNAICPGFAYTPLVEKQIRAAADTKYGGDINIATQALLAEKHPSKAFVTVEQIGDVAVFLASPAADQIRGTTITVDGGWVAQ
ncbi:NAD(P)-dependent oxidoreductase [Trypanosoma rangeli]|uniref:3-oxoacyl-[acyl-carrier-protein] reductase n=1 Tax=Trypanosoma rangeli TaxID=5698 RepID=A0A422NCL5_TRYRA|nr:NAD(P)-dependent oxidoreductase [Trypanosoma rangeli]RNF03211.1 NAD(P)-dependent oxidoreductase [Trypanosoma rangeli]|eukprot:RNF03211.1 NAD(P)-dependent oxidoreductase [Trypanosoma rangeli]